MITKLPNSEAAAAWVVMRNCSCSVRAVPAVRLLLSTYSLTAVTSVPFKRALKGFAALTYTAVGRLLTVLGGSEKLFWRVIGNHASY